MARKIKDEKLDTKTARLSLPVRNKPYWRAIQKGFAIGYRRAANGRAGTWYVRLIRQDEMAGQKAQEVSLGVADDLLDADGLETFSFIQAQEKAREWLKQTTNEQHGVGPALTVADVLAAYVTAYRARGGKAVDRVKGTIEAHILPTLGHVQLEKLTYAIIKHWLQVLATTPARVRAKKDAKTQAYRDAPESDDAKRARRASANRIFTTLKAALNQAYAEGKIASDTAWRQVKPFKNADAARISFLTDDESTRLVNAASPAFRPMIQAGLLTGARWGELTRLQAKDFNPDRGTVHIRESKSNKPRHITLTDEGSGFFAQHCAGKTGDTLIFPRPDGKEWSKSEQHRPMQAACAGGNITPAISFHILRHTYASRLLRLGVTMPAVAMQLGNSETICAKHYAHLAPSHVSDAIRAAFTPIGIVQETSVVTLKRG